MRVAIVGSGISGLYAAYSLSARYDVTLFEAASRIGGHANTVTVDDGEESVGIDTGFIVHNDRNYPLLTSMFEELGVPTQASEMSFSVTDHERNIFYRATNPRTIFAHRPNLINRKIWKMLAEILRFNRLAQAELNKHDSLNLSTAEFCHRHKFSNDFVELYLVPLGASIWSADPRTYMDFPISTLLKFLDNHGLVSLGNRPNWRTVTGGSRVYVDLLVQRLKANGTKILTSSPVDLVQRSASEVTIGSHNTKHTFDACILACHSDQSLALLEKPTDLEKQTLGNISYIRNTATLHTDRSLMPPKRIQWASWNYLRDDNATSARLTYDMNTLQRLNTKRNYFVSLNCEQSINPNSVIYQCDYQHPVFDLGSHQARASYEKLLAQGSQTRTYFAGAYWHYGFHEDGALSGSQAAANLSKNFR